MWGVVEVVDTARGEAECCISIKTIIPSTIINSNDAFTSMLVFVLSQLLVERSVPPTSVL